MSQYTSQDSSTDDISSSSHVISEHLVTFRNIEELQHQNQKLLAVVRELSEEKEQRESECVLEHTKVRMEGLGTVAMEGLGTVGMEGLGTVGLGTVGMEGLGIVDWGL